MAGMDWFRWHHGSVTDPKFQLIAKKSGANVAEVIAVWATLLEAASMADERGYFETIDFDSIECSLGLEDGLARKIFDHMTERGLVEYGYVCSWEKRQPKREREDNTNAERQAAFRAKQKQVTPSNAESHQKTPRVEESREEEIREDKKTERTARGTRLPENFEPDFQFAVDSGIQNTLEEANKFRDYWTAQPGSKGVKLDWPATWRNWCRNARPTARASPYAKPDPAATVPSKPGIDPALAKAIKDSLSGAKPSAEIRQRMAEIKGARA